MIQNVLPNGPAPNGQFTLGDLLLAINDEPIDTTKEMDRVLSQLKVGQKVKLTIQRGGELSDIEVVLEGV